MKEVLKRIFAIFILLLLIPFQLLLKIIIILITKVNMKIEKILKKLIKLLRNNQKIKYITNNERLRTNNV